MIVMKFGGASLADADRIRNACGIVRAHRRRRPVVVLSALRGVTDDLIRTAEAASRGEATVVAREIAALGGRHGHVARRLFQDEARRDAVLAHVARLVHELEDLCRGIGLLGELSRRSLDLVSSLGERFAARIMAAALAEAGLPGVYVDARTFLVTDENHGGAHVDAAATSRGLRRSVLPLVRRGQIPVVTGFIGRSAAGATTTLGRGGSDYTAAILGAGLGAEEIVVWKEVDGVCTADPTLVADARVVPRISYHEAAELSHFGAEVLHPRTMLPAMRKGIPIRVQNTLRPASPGTLITARGGRGRNPLIVSSIDHLSLVTVQGVGLVGSPGVVADALSEVATLGVNVYMVSMASSEYNVSFVIPSTDAARVQRHLTEALRVHHGGARDIESVRVESPVAIIAAVGARMKGQVGVAGRVFSALGKHGVNILAIAQGSSEYNISAVVARRDLKRAVHAIHGEVVANHRPARSPGARRR